MSIDIVIPTCNNYLTKNYSLYYTIRSILSQSTLPDNIFVVENETYDETRSIVEKDFGRLVVVLDGTSKKKNISFARNYGANQGNSDLILFIDDDVIIGRNHFLELTVARMKNIDFACGAKRFWTRTDWYQYLNKSYSIHHIQNILKYKTYLPKSIERLSGNPSFHEFTFIGNFGIIKREVFDVVGRFDEGYKEWLYQDTDLMMRLCTEGYQYDLLENDQISVYHLAHGADKIKYQEINKELFLKKQEDLGIAFRLNHFFGIFDDDSYSILS